MSMKEPLGIFKQQLREPLNSIIKNPYEFAVWWTAAIVFGLAGFWIPLLLCLVQGMDVKEAFFGLINAGTLSAFGVVLLIEGLAAMWVVRNTATNWTATGIRGFVSMLALIVATVQVSLLASQGMAVARHSTIDFSECIDPHSLTPKPALISLIFQIALTLITITFASYLFCFRFGEWEKGVEDFKKEEEAAPKKMGTEAVQKTSDGDLKL